jgi:hypothetical protein
MLPLRFTGWLFNRITTGSDSSDVLTRAGYVDVMGRTVWIEECTPVATAGASADAMCVILCNPLLEERINVHPYFVWFSRFLARYGIVSLRFDYPGTGDSLPIRQVEDLRGHAHIISELAIKARRYFECKAIAVVTISSGMFPVTALNSGIDFAVFLEPFADPRSYIEYLYRTDSVRQQGLSAGGYRGGKTTKPHSRSLNIEGHEIAPGFIDSVENLQPLRDWLQVHAGHVICLREATHRLFGRSIAGLPELEGRVQFVPEDGAFWRTGYGRYLPLPLSCMEATIKVLVEAGA